MDRNTSMAVFSLYSYLNNIIMLLINILPTMPVRGLAFRLILGKVGAAAHIDYGAYFRYPRKIF
ncbi:MAG: hypothetical protein WC316_06200, partial [Candidatus Omnitrophota bacterium]